MFHLLQSPLSNYPESETSTPDETLKDHIAIWEYKLSDKNTDKLTMAILQSVLFVASEILHSRAVLFPHVASVFVEAYGSTSAVISQQPVHLEVGEGINDFSMRWLLNQLIVYLQQHMSYKCVHRKFGTILFCKGGDLVSTQHYDIKSYIFMQDLGYRANFHGHLVECTVMMLHVPYVASLLTWIQIKPGYLKNQGILSMNSSILRSPMIN